MRTAAIILGIITATLLLPQIAFARGGKQKSKSDRRRSKVEVVRRPVEVAPVVVVNRVEQRQHRHARHESRYSSRRRRHPVHHRSRRDVRRRDHRHHEHCGWIAGHHEDRAHQIIVPGFFRKQYVAAKYIQRRGPRGIRVTVQLHPAGWRNVWVPPRTEVHYEQVWVDGHYTCNR